MVGWAKIGSGGITAFGPDVSKISIWTTSRESTTNLFPEH
jgi:hypothetical protein